MIAQVATALVFFSGQDVAPSVANDTEWAVKAQLAREGGTPLDLTNHHRALFTPSLVVDFTAPLPRFLSPELAAPWKSGSEACRQWVGPTGPEVPPAARAASAIVTATCQRALKLAMWDLFLEARRVKRVVSVELDPTGSAATGVLVIASLREPGKGGRMQEFGPVPPEHVANLAAKLVEDLLKGKGLPLQAVNHPLPSVGVPALAAAAFGAPRPAKVPKPCTGLPARLEVFPLGKVTQAVEAAYQTVPANQRTGKPVRCDLVVYPGDDPIGGPRAVGRLGCPGHQVRASEPMADAPSLVATLVDRAVAALCSLQGPQ